MGAKWQVVHATDKVVALEDRSFEARGHDGNMSVTNDAERVIGALHRSLPGGLKERIVIYKDTMGMWDELCHDGQGNFTGFKPVRATTLNGALMTLDLPLILTGTVFQ